jgi:hypothetical protein
MTYLREYGKDMTYIPCHTPGEFPAKFRKWVYGNLRTMSTKASRNSNIRVEAAHPNLNWTSVWRNLHMAWITNDIRSEWYGVIHDLLPTNDYLHRIALKENDQCHTCGTKDTTQHRILEWGEGWTVWRWTRIRLALILRSNADQIPDEWPIGPAFQLWPPQRHGALLWILAHFVYYRTVSQPLWDRGPVNSIFLWDEGPGPTNLLVNTFPIF